MTRPAKTLTVTLEGSNDSQIVDITVNRLIVAGWTGRDVEAMEAHIRELAALGIPRPSRTPIFYRNAVSHLTTANTIEVTGDNTSGEVEFVIFRIGGEDWLGVGSDHTDRELEKQGITLSKQICDKPIASTFWRLKDVADHWDQLQLQSTIIEKGEEVTYQEGPVTAMRTPQDLIDLFSKDDEAGGIRDGDAVMCGTLAAIGGIRPASRFHCRLSDPVLGRSISHAYDIVELPIAG